MLSTHRKVASVAAAVAAVVALGGCGGSSTHTQSSQARAAEATAVAWGKADTPQSVCALMTYGFKMGAGRGQSPARCATWIVHALGPFTATSTRVISTKRVDGQTAVLADFGGHHQTLYLARECGTLKVASVDELHANQPAAPRCP